MYSERLSSCVKSRFILLPPGRIRQHSISGAQEGSYYCWKRRPMSEQPKGPGGLHVYVPRKSGRGNVVVELDERSH